MLFVFSVGLDIVFSGLQMSNSYLLQGEVMDISINSFQIPVASLSLFDSAVIILLVPLVDVVIFPFLGKFNLRPTMLVRIGEHLYNTVQLGPEALHPTIFFPCLGES